MGENKKHLSLPSNYVTLADLQRRWLQQQKQQQPPPPPPPPPPVEPQQPHQHQHQGKKELQHRHARFSSGKRNPYNKNRNHQKNSGDSQLNAENQLVDAGIGGIDRDGDGDVNLEGKCGKELKEKVELKSKQVRVAERGTKLEEEKEEKEEQHQEDLQRHNGTAVRAGRQSQVNRRNHRKIRRDSVTYAEKLRNEADSGIGEADLKSKGNGKLKENEKSKPKPEVYERAIKAEEKKKEKEDMKQEQRSGTASRSFSGKHRRNAGSYSRKVPADFRTNAEKQCGNTGIGEGESTVNATAKPKPLVEEGKTEVEEMNGKKQREEVNDAENEKAKIIQSQSSEEKSCGGGSKMEEVEQRFRGLGFRRALDGFNYTQHRRGSYGGRGYGYSNRNGYRSGYGYDYGYGNSDFGGFRHQHYDASGKRGEKMVWIKKVDNIDGTENEN
ncbi:hypothetical protein PIB30_085718 [Stylosanthes scabra]|uniref:Uncharacterized protein n=1 Tax=Stylosanthes scabra TaxID=79078 RepID=A0ABU6UUQ0_9FABA|nr:hypothetical protein [Stylosanthes scabra]